MIDRGLLLSDLQKLLGQLESDLAARSDLSELPEVRDALKEEYARARVAARTAFSYEDWRSDYATQVAVAWVLGAVFARFLEDNELVSLPRLAGPGERLQRSRDEHELYFRAHPTETDREYLLDVFRELGKLPGMGAIFWDYSPVFELPNWLSGDAAGELLQFFQRIDPETGALVHDFTDEGWDTRFLGDLYQDLSESARKRYALLQTPIFVEEFILDRTLDPAIEEFGLDEFRMIDPACGSGHFLLRAFERILDRWLRREPGGNVRHLAQRALDAVHGVDVNPYAIAIARFRLLLAAMKASGIEALRNAPGFKFKLACGDSLLHGEGSQLVMGDWAPMAHHFRGEDIGALNGILKTGFYHAVVANPPYIVPKDKALNAAYRERYEACYRQYSLAVPFMERIFKLAVPGGFTGQITANSFMKREFGKKLIETFFPKVDLTHVIDTSGAYIPGHGTPTVILFGRNRSPVASVIRTVMGIRGEPSTPEKAENGLVWSAIKSQIDLEGSESDFISVADSQRELFHQHPWSIGGGGASDLKELLESNTKHRLSDMIESPVGRAVRIGEEESFIFTQTRKQNSLCPECEFRAYLIGENLRDWSLNCHTWVWYPYQTGRDESNMLRHLWIWRTSLANRSTFQGVMADAGLEWFDYMQQQLLNNSWGSDHQGLPKVSNSGLTER
ncbi:BREX-2 system adenine-specific DNA-methyltransferase PglX [Lyngbya confervoides]|uniref:site-specific DNA-methyltransferase (adenine-specific) n=1 Tax=Lyngbya confervoides BDU141951 TaxID=1574623 RepID=A0ABD4T842_9CYAN|nr:BREX-2 system adenine-specific DNA-methyltransferase PglX [Lyngbya confervoides]MCM1984643.1 BREX-2 system adenine-specific DNA-methyltransferase PglX [Lyngbya confervoides BDU141951]